MFNIYVISESGQGDQKKTYWNRCGVAFKNRDSSFTLKLDMFPNLNLQLREPKEQEGEKQNGR
jgi:hypothetical protein